jgi:hypothetical protein
VSMAIPGLSTGGLVPRITLSADGTDRVVAAEMVVGSKRIRRAWEGMLPKLGRSILKSIRRTMDEGGRPEHWPDLAESTIEHRAQRAVSRAFVRQARLKQGRLAAMAARGEGGTAQFQKALRSKLLKASTVTRLQNAVLQGSAASHLKDSGALYRDLRWAVENTADGGVVRITTTKPHASALHYGVRERWHSNAEETTRRPGFHRTSTHRVARVFPASGNVMVFMWHGETHFRHSVANHMITIPPRPFMRLPVEDEPGLLKIAQAEVARAIRASTV